MKQFFKQLFCKHHFDCTLYRIYYNQTYGAKLICSKCDAEYSTDTNNAIRLEKKGAKRGDT